VSPVEYVGGKRSLRAYIAVCLPIHCNPSSFYYVHVRIELCGYMYKKPLGLRRRVIVRHVILSAAVVVPAAVAVAAVVDDGDLYLSGWLSGEPRLLPKPNNTYANHNVTYLPFKQVCPSS